MKNHDVKFRAYWKGVDKMIYFDNGRLDRIRSEVGIFIPVPNGEGIYMGEPIWMQFTGLVDKNGKDIFEGDIVKEYFGETGTYVVEWEKAQARFVFSNLDDEQYDYDLVHAHEQLHPNEDLEIIGNIHENPELLQTTPDEKKN